MKKLEHFMLPEHTLKLYHNEAMSSMDLTKNVADKVNEIIDSLNKFSTDDLIWKQEQDGRVHKAILYMKDNLLNSLNDLMVQLRDSGFIDDRIEYHIDDLKIRLDNLLGVVKEGTTTMDAEIIDARIGADQTKHTTAGKSLRDQSRVSIGLINSYVYCGVNSDISIVKLNDGKISITVPSLALMNGVNGVTLSPLDIPSIIDNVVDITTKNEDGSYTFVLNTYCSLVYNMNTNTIEKRAQSGKLYNGDIVMATNLYAQLVGGSLWYEHLWKYHLKNDTEHNDIINNIANVNHGAIGTAYIGTGGKLTFTKVDGGHLDIHFSSAPIILSKDINGKGLSWNDEFTSEIKSYLTVDPDGVGATIRLPYRTNLYFRPSKNKLYISPVSYNAYDSIVLINNLYSSPVSGCLIEEQSYKDYLSIMTTLEMLENAIDNIAGVRADKKVKSYSALFNGTDKIESFAFFTDQHLITTNQEEWEPIVNDYVTQLKKVVDYAPISNLISGGDWLNDSNTQVEACYSLGYIDRLMRNTFINYHGIIGNHDTNYQGKLDVDSESNTGRLANNTLKNVMFRDSQRTYYKFKGDNTEFYLFDSELDWYPELNAYKYEQCKWFASSLVNNESEHIAIVTHIIKEGEDIVPFADLLGQIAKAFNDRGTMTIDGESYDFSSGKGKVEFIWGGHTHKDSNGTLYNIPYIITRDFSSYRTITATYDLVLVDYDNKVIKTVRIGAGADRTIQLN